LLMELHNSLQDRVVIATSYMPCIQQRTQLHIYLKAILGCDSHAGQYLATAETYSSFCIPYCDFFVQNAVNYRSHSKTLYLTRYFYGKMTDGAD
jgi:hypothetical protein